MPRSTKRAAKRRMNEALAAMAAERSADVDRLRAQGVAGLPRKPRASRYPWRSIPVGTVFALSFGVSLKTARAYCAHWSAKLGRRYTCHQHNDGNITVHREK